MKKHVHTFKRVGENWARCTVCSIERKLEELVYLGDAPLSVGMGNRVAWLSIR